jgi:hypothetical protein
VYGDANVEPDEAFVVILSSPTSATLGARQATGSIGNDDVASACAPRPQIVSTIIPRIGTLRIQIRSTQLNTQEGNALQRLRFGTLANAIVTFNGESIASGQTVTLPPHTQTAEFVMRRAVRGRAATVQVTVVDGCGEWTTFVGGGPSADF